MKKNKRISSNKYFWRLSYFFLFFLACRNDSEYPFDSLEEYQPKYDKAIDFKLPQLTPCPEGWAEARLSSGFELSVSYCEPPIETNGNTELVYPLSPDFLPCPEGWYEKFDELNNLFTCSPFPNHRPEYCGDGQVDQIHFPGEPDCQQIGTECSDGDFAPNLPENENIVYVRAREPDGGDGSRLHPFNSIREAINSGSNNRIIALSKGTFDESVELVEGVVLWGACVSETILTSSIYSEDFVGIITSRASNTGARNLQITGQSLGLAVTGEGASFQLEDVVIWGTYTAGIAVANGQMIIKNVVVQNINSRISDGFFGRGLIAQDGANVKIIKSVFSNNREVGIFAARKGTSLTAENVYVRDTIPSVNNSFGVGLMVQEEAEAKVRNSIFQRNTLVGVYVFRGASSSLEDVIVKDTTGLQDGTEGIGLNVENGGYSHVMRSIFEGNRMAGILASSEGTLVTLEDVIVKDTLGENDGVTGMGLEVGLGAHAKVSKSIFMKNRQNGIITGEKGSYVRLEDVLVRDTQGSPVTGLRGRGMTVQYEAEAEIFRSVFQNNHEIGIVVASFGSRARLEDVIVRDTQAERSDNSGGRGLTIQGGAFVEAYRSFFYNNRDIGIFASEQDTTLKLEEVVVKNTQSRQSDGKSGRGLSIQKGVTAEVIRSLFLENREIGVFAFGEKTKLQMTDVIVSHIQPHSNIDKGRGGMGIGAYGSASIDIHRFLLSQNYSCGVQISYGHESETSGKMYLSNGIVSQNEVCGINIQSKDLNSAFLSNNVYFIDNNYNNLNTSLLPFPGISDIEEW